MPGACSSTWFQALSERLVGRSAVVLGVLVGPLTAPRRHRGCLVSAALAAAAVLAIPSAAELPVPKTGGYTHVEFDRDRLKYDRKAIVEAYREVGVRDPRWDEAAVRYLEAAARRFSGQPDAPTPAALAAEGKAVIELGCSDPAVLYCCASFLDINGDPAQAEPLMRRATAAFQESKYPRRRARFAALRLAMICRQLGGEKAAEADKWADLGIKWTGEAGGEVGEQDNEVRMFLQDLDWQWDGVLDGKWRAVYEALKANPKTPRYVVGVIGGWCNIAEAWQARGSGWASEVTQEGWQGFEQHLNMARLFLTRAWKAHPEYPEAPTAMIRVTMGGYGGPGETERLWFERAIAGQLDWEPAYRNLLWALRPRWGGSHEEMYEFGLECLAAERYDTNVPLWYMHTLYWLWEDLDEQTTYWLKPGVYEKLKQMCQRYVAAASDEQVRLSYLTLWAISAWICEQYGDARRLLDELGEKAQRGILDCWGFGWGPGEITSQVHAYSGPTGEKARQAEQLRRRGKLAQAIASYEQVVAECTDEEAIPYLRSRLAALRLEQQFAKGDWVDLKLGPDLVGWEANRGRWEVEADGAVKGSSDEHGLWLLCDADFGRRVELRGEAEFVSFKDPKQMNFAVAVSATGRRYMQHYGVLVEHQGQKVSLISRLGGEALASATTPVKRDRNTFLIQLWDNTVYVYINDRLVHRGAKPEVTVYPPPNAIGVGCVHAGEGASVRCRNLQVRKLTKKPTPPPSER